jgi:TM2 domain-containing membrane protein YozV
VIAALLQLFLPFGTGRFYPGHTGIAVAQLVLVFFGVGVIWSVVDGIVILAGRPTDRQGRPLRP